VDGLLSIIFGNYMTQLIVFLSGPYSSGSIESVEANVANCREWFNLLSDAGHYVICPNLLHDQHLAYPRPYDWYIDYAKKMMSLCDCMVVLGDSPGVKQEIVYANHLNIPVIEYYRSHQDVIDMLDGINHENG